jgi:hypothetical protein
VTRFIFIVTALLVASGCNPDAEEHPVDIQAGALEAPAPPASPELPVAEGSRAEANAAERAGKAEWNKTPTSKVQPIDWPAANGYAHVPLGAFPESERPKLEATNVPVLVPRDTELLKSAFVTMADDWYAVALHDDGANLHIRGTRRAFDFEGDVWTDKEKGIGDNYTLTRTHQIVTVAFGSFGAAYTVDVECSRPMDDTRCTDDDYALELANSLAVAGGLR